MGSIAESYKKILSEDAKTEQKNNVKDEYSDKETQDMDEMDAKQGDEEKGSTPDVNDGSPTDSLAKSKRSGVQDKTELSDDSTKIDDSQDHVKDVDKAEDSKGISEKEDEDDDDKADSDADSDDEDKDDDKKGKFNFDKKDKKDMKEGIKLDIDVSEDVEALFSGETLSEEFKAKATTIFEAAVTQGVKKQVVSLEEKFQARLDEQVEEIETGLVEQVDSFLNATCSDWLKENKIELEHGIRLELAENTLQGLHSVLSENYIDLPEQKESLIEKMLSDIERLEGALDEEIEKNVSLQTDLSEGSKVSVLEQASAGLTDTQKEKFASLVEDVDFTDKESYSKKLSTLKENYFSSKGTQVQSLNESEEDIDTGEQLDESVSSAVNYLKTTKR